jgi:lipoprotein-anchoring transpeptidase ErfK/SrfK
MQSIENSLGWLGSWHRLYDRRTNGCVAVTNQEIEEIWNLVADGIPVDILP